MRLRPIIVATAMAVFTSLPLNAASAQVTQQQQQRGTLATITLDSIVLTADDVVADSNKMSLAPQATATFTLTQATKELCYEVEFDAVPDSTIASIHKAPKGQNGPSVLALAIRKDTVLSKECVQVDPTVFDEIVVTPSNFYIQLNNPNWKKGAIRGQLAKPPRFH